MNKRPSVFKRNLVVDHKIQLPLLTYSLGMTAVGVALSAGFATLWATLHNPNNSQWMSSLIFLCSAIVIFTIMLFVGLLVTNKVAGPISRLHKHIIDVAEGKTIDPIETRKDDFLSQDLIRDYNRMLEKLRSQ